VAESVEGVNNVILDESEEGVTVVVEGVDLGFALDLTIFKPDVRSVSGGEGRGWVKTIFQKKKL
jgi:hypothetical protein